MATGIMSEVLSEESVLPHKETQAKQTSNIRNKLMNCEMAVDELTDGWMEYNVKGFIRDSSMANYLNHSKHIKKYLGNVRANTLTRQQIQQFIIDISNNEKLSPGTVRAIVTTLSSLYKCAIESDILTKNPCSRLKLPALKEKEIKVLTKHEQDRLERSILNGKDYREKGVLICLYTGIRLGELCALKWDSIDFKERLLYIRSSINRVKVFDGNSTTKTRITETEPKTAKSRRAIPLPDFLCAMLKSMKSQSQSKYIIHSKSGKSLPLQPRTMQHVYKRLLKRAGLNYVNFHTLRHTFATRSIELGADVKSISEILGHSNVAITMNRYTHSLLEQKRKIMNKMNLLFSSKKKTRIDFDTGTITHNNINCVKTKAINT